MSVIIIAMASVASVTVSSTAACSLVSSRTDIVQLTLPRRHTSIHHDSITLPTSNFLWSPYAIGQAIIFFALWFLSSFFFYLFSSPNLSDRRLDVYHTSTHGVALRIWNAGLKCAARGSLEIHDAKNRHFGTIAQICRAISSQLRHISTIRKKPVKQQHLLHMSW